jgi:hypothetical protein
VSIISPYLEEGQDAGEPSVLSESQNQIYQGSIFLGDGFLLSHAEKEKLVDADQRNQKIIAPVINGEDVSSDPKQAPSRDIINFSNRTEDDAASYVLPFTIVEAKVKPARLAQKNAGARAKWWLYYRYNEECYRKLRDLPWCFVAVWVSKYLSFTQLPTDLIFTNSLYVFTTDRWDLFCAVQSTLHEVWARKYSGTLETRLRYTPTDCFETFAFPDDLWRAVNPDLASIGERYHQHRKSLMLSFWLGLTDIYNLFHARNLSPAMVAKVSKKSADEAARGYEGLLELRRLHVQLDLAVRDAYGWQNLPLDHDFYEVETLAENDRVRYTISPAARKEVLRRLLKLNHERAAEEEAKRKAAPKAARGKRGEKALSSDAQPGLSFEAS